MFLLLLKKIAIMILLFASFLTTTPNSYPSLEFKYAFTQSLHHG